LPAFRQKYCKRVLVAVESQIFSDEFIYDEILVREIGSRGRCIVKSAKNFSSDFGSDLGEHSPFFECFFEYFFEFVDRRHII